MLLVFIHCSPPHPLRWRSAPSPLWEKVSTESETDEGDTEGYGTFLRQESTKETSFIIVKANEGYVQDFL